VCRSCGYRVALTAPGGDARAKYKLARQLDDGGVAGGAAVLAAALWLTGGSEAGIAVAVTPRLDKGAGLDAALRS